MPSRKNVYFFRKMVENAKSRSKSNLPLSLTALFYPFLRVLKKKNQTNLVKANDLFFCQNKYLNYVGAVLNFTKS